MRTKTLKALSTMIGIWIAVSALLSGFSITAFAAEEPSKVKFSLTITDLSGTVSPITYVYFCYPYVYESEAGTKGCQNRSEFCFVTPVEGVDGKYTFEGTLSEKINNLDGGALNCYVRFYYGENYKYLRSQTLAYTNENTEMKFSVESNTMVAITPGWEEAYIYSFDDCDDCYISELTDEGDRYTGDISVYLGGGNVATPGGGTKNTKNKHLTLWENFSGELSNTTESDQIKWIVTKDNNCPTSFKQRSDTSVCRVSKGKVTPVAVGSAYVWACRVDPNDDKKVSVNESCCVKVYVYEAPTKITLAESRDANAAKVTKLNMNVGDTKKIYMNFESKGNGYIDKDCTFEVTKGSEYISVSGSYGYFTVTALPTTFEKNKTVKATVVVQSKYNTKKAKLNITVGNGIVDFDQDNVQPLTITSSSVNQEISISAETLNSYIITAGEKNFPDNETISAMETTDKPQVFVTNSADVNDSMVYKTTSSGTSIKFSGAKSQSVSASYTKGVVSVKIKKNAPAQSGNIIIVFNTEKYLAIPFTIS